MAERLDGWMGGQGGWLLKGKAKYTRRTLTNNSYILQGLLIAKADRIFRNVVFSSKSYYANSIIYKREQLVPTSHTPPPTLYHTLSFHVRVSLSL